jgi:hypothetical protein
VVSLICRLISRDMMSAGVDPCAFFPHSAIDSQ